MDKAALVQIINQRLFFPMVAILVVYFVASYVNMRLGFEFVGAKVGKKIWPSVFIMVFYTLYAQNLIPLLISGIIMMPFVAILIKLTTKKVSIIEAFWASILILISNAIGFILITPLCLNKNIEFFFMKTLYEGNITATLIETIFPALALLYLPKLKSHISFVSFLKDKFSGFNIMVLITYLAMFSAFNSAGFAVYRSLKSDPRHIFWSLIYQWIIALIIILGHYTITRSMKRNHQAQQHANEERIAKLEEQNRELKKLNDYLETRHNDEIKEIKESLQRMEENNNRLISQIKSSAPLKSEMKPDNSDELSKRDVELIKLVALNKTTDEITTVLHLSDNSVRKYISNLYGKLGLRNNRVELARYAVKHGFIKMEDITIDRDELEL